MILSDKERGIDRTIIPANDCNRVQNAPLTNSVPSWWLEEETDPKQLETWIQQIKDGQITVEKQKGGEKNDNKYN